MATDRIEWADDLLLARAGKQLRVLDDTLAVRAVIEDVADARWTGSDIVAIVRDRAVRLDADGRPRDTRELSEPLHGADLARDGERVAGRRFDAPFGVFSTWSGRTIGSFAAEYHDVRTPLPGSLTVTLSDNGKLLAITYDTYSVRAVRRVPVFGTGGTRLLDADGPSSHGAIAHGWLVFDVDKAKVVDRMSFPTERRDGPLHLAFDGTGRRLAIAAPEAGGRAEVIRINRPEARAGGTSEEPIRAVALDRTGVLACFASPGRVRVDSFEGERKGDSHIPLADRLALAIDMDPVAVAFSPDSRRIACLARDGRVEIVPVP